MNFRGDGQTIGSADVGFSRAAHCLCLCFRATRYGILLQKQTKNKEKVNIHTFSEIHFTSQTIQERWQPHVYTQELA